MHSSMDLSSVTLSVGIFLLNLLLVETASIEPFLCGAGICNLPGDDDQFCTAGPESRCVFCHDVAHTCFKESMPFNCTNRCLDLYVTVVVETHIKKLKEEPCPKLGNITHGFHNGSAVAKPGDVVVSKCHTGFNMTGSKTIRCMLYGQWSDILPTCKETQCDDPVIKHGTITNSMAYKIFKPGMNVTYMCENGYSAIAPEASCLSDGIWRYMECIKYREVLIKSDQGIDKIFFWISIAFNVILISIVCILVVVLCCKCNQQIEGQTTIQDKAGNCTAIEAYDKDFDKTTSPLMSTDQSSPSLIDNGIKETVLTTEYEKESDRKLFAQKVPPKRDKESIDSMSYNHGQEYAHKTEDKTNPDRKFNGTENKDSEPRNVESKDQSIASPCIVNIYNSINNSNETKVAHTESGQQSNDNAKRNDEFNCAYDSYARFSTEATRDQDDKETDVKEVDTDSDGNYTETEVTRNGIQPSNDVVNNKEKQTMALLENTVEMDDFKGKNRTCANFNSKRNSNGDYVATEPEGKETLLNINPENPSQSGTMTINQATIPIDDLKDKVIKDTGHAQPVDRSGNTEPRFSVETAQEQDEKAKFINQANEHL